MRTVSQISALLSSYVTPGATFRTSLNMVLDRLYQYGDCKDLEAEVSFDGTSGYICLVPDYASILAARINDIPVDIKTTRYEYQRRGPGLLYAPTSTIYGLIDEGFVPVMSDLPEDGLAALTFTVTGGGVWATGDSIVIVYDTASHGRKTSTLAIASGLTAGQTTATLTPLSNITSFTAISHTSMPDRVLATQDDEDDNTIIYAILLPGDNTARFRRYQVPQAPTADLDTYTVDALCKRAFIPLVADTDYVILDNIQALRYGLLALVQDDAGNHDEADILWERAYKALNDDLSESRGGAEGLPNIEFHGRGIAPISSWF
jgi:hypothetical protein